MEFFQRAKAVRLRSQHGKYLVATDEEVGVKQSRTGSSKKARWVVEPVEGKPNLIRLKNADTWRYLCATSDPFLLGMTGRKVGQASPRLKLDPSVEWEPVKDGPGRVRFRTQKGTFLRANGGKVPPWNGTVTHDVPSRNVTSDWVVWSVDVLEVDYQLSSTTTEESKVSNSNVVESGPGLGSGGGGPDDGLSRTSSCSLSASVSVTGEIPAPSPKASPKASAKPSGVSPLIQEIRNESENSNSFKKLKSMLDGLQDILDVSEGDKNTKDDDTDSDSFVDSSSQPHQLEVKMAKQILKELKNMDYNELLSSGRDKKVHKAVNILVADAKASSAQGQVPNDLAGLADQLKSMRDDHESASKDLSDWETFFTKRSEVKFQLKKDAAKAHELETMEVGFTNMLVAARAKKEELLKQLEEIDNSIRAAERTQADNAVEIEELITRIGERSESLREMERQEKSWQGKKLEAERTLERVEEDWVKVKSLFIDV